MLKNLADYPNPGPDPVARLAHVNAVFADEAAGGTAVLATHSLGTGEATGLTYGDLRQLGVEIERLRAELGR